MMPLTPPDSFCLSAAIGWLELGNPTEALAELRGLGDASARHPDVLEVRWQISAERKDWTDALEQARALISIDPDRPTGWLHQAYALRRVPDGGLHRAHEALLPVAERFPQESVIPYNLACYACQMQQIKEARVWLRRAMHVGGRERIRQMALSDDDLKPMWDEVRGM
jgi:predicted Zn-dependent protease